MGSLLTQETAHKEEDNKTFLEAAKRLNKLIIEALFYGLYKKSWHKTYTPECIFRQVS